MVTSKWFFNARELCEFCNKTGIRKKEIIQVVPAEKGSYVLFYEKGKENDKSR